MNPNDLRSELEKCAPKLISEISTISAGWVSEIVENLERRGETTAFPKTFTDAVLGPIELFEWEFIILDSPLLQRLRGIRQLGMAHAVYTCAVHDRLSHCLGVVEIASRMIKALEKNAEYRRKYGINKDEGLPPVDESDRSSVRLAALLHDIGHASFSHASESLIRQRRSSEIKEAVRLLRTEFEGAQEIKPSEVIAVLIILSEPFRRVFEHTRFRVPFTDRDHLPQTICARILGSRKYLKTPYLSGIVSGAVDADKLDYMARDSYFTGLPIGLDVNRLIGKLEIITITPENVSDPELRLRAASAPHKRLYQLGISLSGLTAYEQMIVGRVLLYDRVYYHHKVRCGEAMARRLFELAEEERGESLSLSDLFSNVTDDGMIYLLSGDMQIGQLRGGGDRARKLGRAIRVRRFYHRAFAFAERFLSGLQDLDDEEEKNTRASQCNDVYEGFNNPELGKQIYELAVKLRDQIPELKRAGSDFSPEHIMIDLPDDRVTVQGRKLLVRTESGVLTNANLFFNPDKWSQAYRNQKQCGYVFTPKEHIEVVAIASQIVFQQKFGVVMRKEAQHLCKIEHLLTDKFVGWMKQAFDAGLCTPECFKCLTEPRITLLRIREEDIKLPPEWIRLDPQIKVRLAQQFFDSLPGGLVASMRDAVVGALENLCYALDSLEKTGVFLKDRRPDEKRDLQAEILKALRSRGIQVAEGTEVSGGESDIILPGELILENKVEGETTDIGNLKPNAAWQARRYSIALNRRVSFVLIAYKPANEGLVLPLPSRISIYPLPNAPEICAVVRLIIPWGHDVPSRAKAP